MSYKKTADQNSTYYYNSEAESVIVESEGEYKVIPLSAAPSPDEFPEIDQEEFDDKVDDIVLFARLGSHPPHGPGH